MVGISQISPCTRSNFYFRGTMLCSIFIFIGSVVSAMGSNFESFNLVIGGRIILGLGSTVIESAGSKILAHWFQHRGLAFVYGLDIAWGQYSLLRIRSLNETLKFVNKQANVSSYSRKPQPSLCVTLLVSGVGLCGFLPSFVSSTCSRTQSTSGGLSITSLRGHAFPPDVTVSEQASLPDAPCPTPRP